MADAGAIKASFVSALKSPALIGAEPDVARGARIPRRLLGRNSGSSLPLGLFTPIEEITCVMQGRGMPEKTRSENN